MKNYYLSFLLVLITAAVAAQPLTGTKTIKTAGGDYATFNAAISDLNTNGVGSGGVVFNVEANFSSIEDPIAITATGTAVNPIVFQKNGVGANPTVRPGGTVATNDFGFKIAGGDYITFDGIDITINVGSAVEWGYVLEGVSTNGCQYNTIKNCSITLSKANTVSRGIYTFFVSSPTSLANANSNNKFYNINIQNVYNGYFLSGNSTYPDQNTEIGTINGGTATLTNLGGGTATCSIISVTNQNNIKIFNQNITNNSTTTGQINGILYSGTSTSATIYNNTISALSSSTTSTSTVYGMNFSSANNITVYDNTIDNIGATTGPAAGINASGSGTNPRLTFYANNIQRVSTGGTSAANSAFGFTNSGPGVIMNFYRNFISNIENKAGAAGGLAVGVNISGTTCNVYNNFISDIKMTAGTAVAGVRGLSLVGGTSNLYVYHNSVYLDYVPSSASASGAALYLANLSNSFDIRNNIFVNNMNNAIGAKSVALYSSSNGNLARFAAVCDNNLYYAGVPSPTNLIYFDSISAVNNNRDQTLGAFKNRIATREQHSISELPPFISTVAPYNLHLNPSVATQCEKGGQTITKPLNIDRDYDGTLRGATYSDIGADEDNFAWLDQTGPYISYVPFNKTTLFTARTLSATIHDPSGVPVAGAGLPVLYWKINAAAAFTPVTATFVSGSTYTFTFGQGVALNDSITYYVVAQDMASGVNVLAYPSAGAAGYNSSVPAASTPPVTPSFYKVVNPIVETLLVGAGQSYTSLTGAAPGGLFAALKDGVLTQNLEIRITSNLTETGQNDLTQWLEEGPGNYSVTFRPNSGTTKEINSGSLVNSAIIRLNGVKNAIFDGSYNESGNYLTFRNKEDFTSVFFFHNDASKNTITNCTVEGLNNSLQQGLIQFYGGVVSGNDSNLVSNCIIRDRSDGVTGKAQILIYSDVPSTTFSGIYNTGNSVINNKMFNFGYCGFYSVGLNEDWTISGNEIYDTLTGGSNVFGIRLGSQGTNIVTQNNIHDLKCATNGQLAGIVVQGAVNTMLTKNRIYNFPATTGSLGGIIFYGSSGPGTSVTAANNQITINPAGNSSQYIVGIFDNGTDGSTLNAYNNSILIGGTSTSTTNSWAFLRQPIGNANGSIRNNIFYNNRSGGGSANFALGNEKFGSGDFNVSNNLYLGTGVPDASFMDRAASGTTGESFASWVAATHDISSYAAPATTINPDVLFKDVATGNLDINNTTGMCWYVNGKALPLAGLADDYSGNSVRSTTLATGSADIGSDEFTTSTLPPVLATDGAHAPGGTENFTFAGRTLASITWGAGSVSLPNLGNIMHYTGEWPNDITNNGTVTGARTLNEWWDIPATGGSAYTYSISLNYDSAMLGKVQGEGSMTINKKQTAVAGTWATVNPTTVNVYDKIMTATGVSSFSEFTGSDFDHNLPVQLLAFNALVQANDVVLHWSTASEINHHSYELERSTDGRNFKSFAAIAGAGNSSTVSHYSEIDAAVLINYKNAERIYYRLKMIGTNGLISYSQIVIVRPGKFNGQLVQAIMPNPFVNRVSISLNLPQAGIVTARLMDMGGKQLTNNSYQAASGFSTIQINDLDRLSKGMYLLELRYNNKIITRKLVKE
ncbi:MAG: T9SS type A sorting domain-containing protein [Bacteroidota bacterium]